MAKRKIRKDNGRPKVITDEVRTGILDALRKALPLSYACDLNGIGRQTVYDHMNRDKTFRTQVAIAKAEAIRGLVALTGKQGGAWKLLKNLGREEFTDTENVNLTEIVKKEEASKMSTEDVISEAEKLVKELKKSLKE